MLRKEKNVAVFTNLTELYAIENNNNNQKPKDCL